MKRIALSIIVSLIISTSLFGFSINIDPPSIYTKAKPGQTVTSRIVVENTSKQPITVKVYAQDWIYNNKQNKQFLNLGSTPYSLQNNLKLYVSVLAIPSKEKREVIFDITSPKDKKGGLYGVIFFEAKPVLANQASKVKLIGRIGTIIYHEITDTQTYDFDIEYNSFQKSSGKRFLNFTLTNQGNTHLDLQGSLLILSKNRTVIERIDIEQLRSLPSQKRTFTLQSKRTYEPKDYTGLFTLRYGDERVFSKQIQLVKKPESK